MKPQPPQPGWTTPVQVSRVIDGDTIEVVVQRKIHVRLLDCWAPETRTRDLAEKARGLDAKVALETIIEKHDGGSLTLFIPSGQGQDLSEVFTFGRVLGRLWLPNGREVSRLMVEAGHATSEKTP